jgi:hypothetical protein
MQNVTCSEIHVDVLLFLSGNVVRGDDLQVPPSGCCLKKDSKLKQDRALGLVRNTNELAVGRLKAQRCKLFLVHHNAR